MPPSRRKTKRRTMRAEDLFELRVPTSVALSPDESRAAYTLERADAEKNGYVANLRVVDLQTGADVAFTHHEGRDEGPAWSTTGDRIAFVSRQGKKAGIYVISAHGGSEECLLEVDGSIDHVQWAPGDRELVFSLRQADEHQRDTEGATKPPVYRHITSVEYRLDGSGFNPRQKHQVVVLDVESRRSRALTRGRRDNTLPCVSRDGKWVAFVSNRRRNAELMPQHQDLYLVPIAGGKERKLPTPPGEILNVAWSPDGKALAFIGHDQPHAPWGTANPHVWVVDRSGRRNARNLMPTFDRGCLDQCVTDTSNALLGAPLFWAGNHIYFVVSNEGRTTLHRLSRRGGTPREVCSGKHHLRGLAVAGRGKRAVGIRADLSNPGEIVTIDTTGRSSARVLTSHNAFLRREVQLGRTREVWFRSTDGVRVQGWVVTPPGFVAKRKYPALLQIHGGPAAQYAFSFMHEMQTLAARGYVVLYANPRGGLGRGEAWAQAIAGGWGESDYEDCMAAADWLERQPWVNGRKLGVTGGSYGGFMTNWIVGHTDRFAAAVSQRSVSNLMSMFGTSDIGYTFDLEFPGFPWTNRDLYEKCSPLNYVENATTPLLILHSEDDLRCPIEQAEQLFVKMKLLGKTVEFVRFPQESHGLSRQGRPDRRLARLEWIEKWFRKYLFRR